MSTKDGSFVEEVKEMVFIKTYKSFMTVYVRTKNVTVRRNAANCSQNIL